MRDLAAVLRSIVSRRGVQVMDDQLRASSLFGVGELRVVLG